MSRYTECGRHQGGIYKCSGDWQKPVLGELNERAISIEEVRDAVNEIKSGEAPGLDGLPVECLKKGGMAPVRIASETV